MKFSVKSMVVGAVVGTVVAGGIAVAAIPDANGVYSACMNQDRTIKMINYAAGQRCTSTQKLLTWNQKGQTGARGPAGADGVDATRTVYVRDKLEDLRYFDAGQTLQVASFDPPDGLYLWNVSVTVMPLEVGASGRVDCTFSWMPQSSGYNVVRGQAEVNNRSATVYMSTLANASFVEGPETISCTASGTTIQIDQWRVTAQPIDDVNLLTNR